MSRDTIIKEMLPKTVSITPEGFLANELNPNDFAQMQQVFIEKILEISKADISHIDGYGEFNDDCQTEYVTCREFLTSTFTEDQEGYWYHWKEMFETTILNEEVFNKFYKMMEERIDYCEGKRFLVNNNTFFVNMITDGDSNVGFPDWSRAGVSDFLLDFAITDINKPYLMIPEFLIHYCSDYNIEIPNFKERYLCMAYYKALDCLRWHASIDDKESCDSITRYLYELEDRIKIL